MEHTLSPIMHNAAFEKLNLNFVYLAFRVSESELKNATVGARSLGIRGLNVTMPHKEAIIQFIDEIEPTAKSIGSVNTILIDQGRIKGYNTDGLGALKALKENGVNVNGKKLLLLGAGGAGKAIAFHVARESKELVILNRTTNKAKELARFLSKKFGTKTSDSSLDTQIIKRELKDAEVLINATSIGMYPNIDQSLVDLDWLRPDLCVMDIVYNPMETRLLKNARSIGAKVVNGIDMLVYQGAASFEIWTGHSPPIKVMKQAILNKLLTQVASGDGKV